MHIDGKKDDGEVNKVKEVDSDKKLEKLLGKVLKNRYILGFADGHSQEVFYVPVPRKNHFFTEKAWQLYVKVRCKGIPP